MIRNLEEAKQRLAEIIKVQDGKRQVMLVTVEIATCKDSDARKFLSNARERLIELQSRTGMKPPAPRKPSTSVRDSPDSGRSPAINAAPPGSSGIPRSAPPAKPPSKPAPTVRQAEPAPARDVGSAAQAWPPAGAARNPAAAARGNAALPETKMVPFKSGGALIRPPPRPTEPIPAPRPTEPIQIEQKPARGKPPQPPISARPKAHMPGSQDEDDSDIPVLTEDRILDDEFPLDFDTIEDLDRLSIAPGLPPSPPLKRVLKPVRPLAAAPPRTLSAAALPRESASPATKTPQPNPPAAASPAPVPKKTETPSPAVALKQKVPSQPTTPDSAHVAPPKPCAAARSQTAGIEGADDGLLSLIRFEIESEGVPEAVEGAPAGPAADPLQVPAAITPQEPKKEKAEEEMIGIPETVTETIITPASGRPVSALETAVFTTVVRQKPVPLPAGGKGGQPARGQGPPAKPHAPVIESSENSKSGDRSEPANSPKTEPDKTETVTRAVMEIISENKEAGSIQAPRTPASQPPAANAADLPLPSEEFVVFRRLRTLFSSAYRNVPSSILASTYKDNPVEISRLVKAAEEAKDKSPAAYSDVLGQIYRETLSVKVRHGLLGKKVGEFLETVARRSGWRIGGKPVDAAMLEEASVGIMLNDAWKEECILLMKGGADSREQSPRFLFKILAVMVEGFE